MYHLVVYALGVPLSHHMHKIRVTCIWPTTVLVVGPTAHVFKFTSSVLSVYTPALCAVKKNEGMNEGMNTQYQTVPTVWGSREYCYICTEFSHLNARHLFLNSHFDMGMYLR